QPDRATYLRLPRALAGNRRLLPQGVPACAGRHGAAGRDDCWFPICLAASEVLHHGCLLHPVRRALFWGGVPDLLHQTRSDPCEFRLVTQLHSFVCPHCLGWLTETPTALSCQGCGQTFPLSHGVPNFSTKSDYYYGEFPQ